MPAAFRTALRALLVAFACAACFVAAPAANASPAAPGDPVGVSVGGLSVSGQVVAPAAPVPGATPAPTVRLDLGGGTKEKPNQAITLVLLLTVLSVAPAVLILTTSFTRIVIVLSLTRNALGVQAIPPNQVIVGLSLFLSLFVMGPTLSQVNDQAIQPFLNGDKTYGQAYEAAVGPMRAFMLKEVKQDELALFVKEVDNKRPARPEDVSMSALVPAFIVSEIKTAFLIGFIIFIPFLVIDIVVSSSLMAMGMMMLPPVLISLPFKLLLFVMVDGWALIIRALLQSYA
jgi:flagellar biosynthetic protein FliP